MGRFVHIPPSDPSDQFQNNYDLPWWKDHKLHDPKLWIGMLSNKTRRIRIVNMLTKDEHTLEVCSEDTLDQIKDKYTAYNWHAGSYVWKRLNAGEMQVMDMSKTLEENGVEDEGEELEGLGLDPADFVPGLALYFKDDLSLA
mmetsp:Transcript_22048/g.60395  ORF Transcript_22048/g.60395 Transcript_22048/m.60395 type:complete len:142 (-) Transcript_22048:10-435(-)